MHAVFQKLYNTPDMVTIKKQSAQAQRKFFSAKTQQALETTTLPDIAFKELSIPTHDGYSNRARLYTPKTLDQKSALIVYIHGGGWTLGDIQTYHIPCSHLANNSHIKLISLEYRLAPEHKFPTAVNDCLDMFEWIAQNSAELGADKEELIIIGDSGGANLATVVCHELLRLGKSTPKLQVLIYPSCDNTKEAYYASRLHYMSDAHHLTPAWFHWFQNNYISTEEDRNDPRFSPLLYPSHKGLPKSFVLLAEEDPLKDEGSAYANALLHDGVEVQVTVYPGMVHGFFSLYNLVDEAKMASLDIAAFLKQY